MPLITSRDVSDAMSDDRGLTDDDIEQLQQILENNQECGANEHTMATDVED